MNENLSRYLEILLNNFWILKDDNLDLYYELKRNQEEIRNYVTKNMGSKLIIHERFIKLEKIPPKASSNMGIESFKRPSDYTYLCIVLLYLEDKTRGNYFMLSSLIEYVKTTSTALELNHLPDWTLASDRRSLKRAIDFLISLGAIKLKDENKINFNENENAEALYEATGLSNYVMRMFTNEIFNYEDESDFIKDEWQNQSEEKGDIRKYKVYRGLVFTPCLLGQYLSESEQDYIKKLRGYMREDLMNNLGLELEVTRNMAFVYEYEISINKDFFPNTKKITDVILILNKMLLDLIEDESIKLNEYEIGRISEETLRELIKDVKINKVIYLSKQLKDLSDENFFLTVSEAMEKYNFLKKVSNYYEIYPTIKRFTAKLSEKNEELTLFRSDEDV